MSYYYVSYVAVAPFRAKGMGERYVAEFSGYVSDCVWFICVDAIACIVAADACQFNDPWR